MIPHQQVQWLSLSLFPSLQLHDTTKKTYTLYSPNCTTLIAWYPFALFIFIIVIHISLFTFFFRGADAGCSCRVVVSPLRGLCYYLRSVSAYYVSSGSDSFTVSFFYNHYNIWRNRDDLEREFVRRLQIERVWNYATHGKFVYIREQYNTKIHHKQGK